MKRYFLYIILISASCHPPHKDKKLSGIYKLPAFKILSADSSAIFDTKHMPEQGPLVFIYFNSDCDHCQKETKDLLKHSLALKKARIYMISNEPLQDITKFLSTFHIERNKNITVGKDYEYTFYKAYLPSVIPFIAIYNNRILKRIYRGETDINSIINTVSY